MTAKDLKPGDILYFLDTDRHFVSTRKVIGVEEYPFDYGDDKYLKIIWEKEEYSYFPNYCVIQEDDTSFWEEPDYDSEDYEENEEEEDDGRLIFINREDIVSRIEKEIERLQSEIKDLYGKES